MELKEFLSSEIGQYVTARLDQRDTIQDIIADFDDPILEIEEMLAISLETHCTPQELEAYPESDERYECTPHGRYLEQCIQYARSNADLIIANHNADQKNKIYA